jgi:hypothetical protein
VQLLGGAREVAFTGHDPEVMQVMEVELAERLYSHKKNITFLSIDFNNIFPTGTMRASLPAEECSACPRVQASSRGVCR